uniref:acetyl-CoA C-acyltransferase n=1 Tax=Hemiselmis tepida TaxID=464990 RepID=A0A7S0W9W9_9CRYP|mmetsp:Transcript_9957/g.25804  ORF Transcript_9957/g.25804 Transcript_9957/m.25804 type:complete len:402 (+) Transcript_9957:3-1208(+)
MAHDLLREAIKGLMAKSEITAEEVDYCLMGTVIQEVLTSNIAREASMGAGLPTKMVAHTSTQACISANTCTATGMGLIQTDHCDVVMAGGVEVMSDLPIRFSRPIRKRLLKLGKAKTTQAKLNLLSGLTMADLTPQAPGVAEFSTGEIMGYSADKLAASFGISRVDQDTFAARSHQAAQDATDAGHYKGELIPVMGSKGKMVTVDNGIRPTSVEKLGALKPAFIKPHGTVTAASSSFLTDGASASLITSEEYAKSRGIKYRSLLKDFCFAGCDPKQQLLLGPAHSTAALLKRNNLKMTDIDIIEFHEAFAGQVLSNIAALNSDAWCKENVGMDKVGEMKVDIMNTRGGSLSLGHPFGATGTRLIKTATERLKFEDKKLALVTACAAGGQGVAMLIERVPNY